MGIILLYLLIMVQPAIFIKNANIVQPGQSPEEIAHIFITNRSLYESNGGHHFCGGVLISDRHILTAAHCFDWFSMDPTTAIHIYIDELECLPKRAFDMVRVANLYIHEDYILGRGENDIAIVRLNRHFHRGTSLQLASNDRIDYAGVEALFYGCGAIWKGLDKNDRIKPRQLRWATQTIVLYKNSFPGFIFSDGVAKICGGDSGYPLFFKDRIIGICSGFGPDDPLCEKPAIHTRVSSYYGWIIRTITNDGIFNIAKEEL